MIIALVQTLFCQDYLSGNVILHLSEIRAEAPLTQSFGYDRVNMAAGNALSCYCLWPSFRTFIGLMNFTLLISLYVVPGSDFLAAGCIIFLFFFHNYVKIISGFFSTSPKFVSLWNMGSIFCLGASYLTNILFYILSNCLHLINLHHHQPTPPTARF